MEAKTPKSEMTRAAIVDAALDIAETHGMRALSMQAVADRLHISKSGVFSRSGSLEALQQAVLDEYGRRFVARIFAPAMQKAKGLERLNEMVQRWLEQICRQTGIGGSLYEATAFSIDPIEQTLHDSLAARVRDWRSSVRRTIVQALAQGELRAGLDPDQMNFELHCLFIGALYEANFLKDPKTEDRALTAYQRLLDGYRK